MASLSEVPDPMNRLEVVRRAREALERLERATVAEARAAGATWGEIGTMYGVSKQAAQQRFRRR
jgi:predicted CoA-binding protein